MPGKLYRFGLFELNTATRQLRKQGRQVRVQEQPLRVLEILLERPEELITRQELRQRLWPSDVYVDFELGLNGAIKRLRLALGDSADNPRFIETVPKSGYRFIAPVQSVEEGEISGQGETASASGGAATQTAPAAITTSAQTASRGLRYFIAGLVAVVVLGLAYLLRPPNPNLQVTRIVKLSNNGRAWSGENLLSDGPRLYYTETESVKGLQLRQILLNGNEDNVVKGMPSNGLIRALSPDHTMFLALSREPAEDGKSSSAWVVPVVGGPARRLGNLLLNDVTYSPDGTLLAFARDSQLFIANADGTRQRSVATVAGQIVYPRWSPDGLRLRFSVFDIKAQSSIWEVRTDGSGLRQMQFGWPGSPMESFGDWTSDGRYYIFTSRREGISNLWAFDEQADWLHRRHREPMQLTAGPMGYYRPLPSRDGTRIFALGVQLAGELLRYDAAQNQFVPYLAGLSADHLSFSSDGRWLTYISYPDGMLWRSRSDGSERLQLTFPPGRALNPHWSPDGKRILFVMRRSGDVARLYTISAEGGNPEPLMIETQAQTSASWSAAGDSVYYGRYPEGESQDIYLYRFDVKSGRTERIAGTEGLYAPVVSPDGRTLAAQTTAADHELVLLDLKSGKRSTLLKHKADYPVWSADSQYIYFNTVMGEIPALYRAHVPDGREEKIADVRFSVTGTYGVWSGLTLDGSPLILRALSQTDVYALNVKIQ
jgi:Tol biopolymer transport system component/DNA-binding winged helix-turn-helix (wHTH) protein